MGSDVARNLMVRIGGVGCLINLTWIVEIREQIADLLDFSHNDPDLGIVGSLSFRQTRIPIIDPTLCLGLRSQTELKDKTALVLKSSEGNWALLVDRVAEICPADRFTVCAIPALLKATVTGFYSQIMLFQGEPMVVLEPDLFYGSSAVA
jgi:chemotaxis signal transduction protein